MRNLTNLKTWWVISVFMLMVVICASSVCMAGTYGGGDGTAANPYQIWTAEQMNTIGLHSEDWDKHFILTEDIDLGAYTGTQFNLIGTSSNGFRGVFDGNGKTISNFTYSFSGTSNCGLFVAIRDDAVIKNLRLKSANVVAVPGQTSGLRVGSLVGRMYGGRIEDCSTEDVYVSGGDYRIGGLVGAAEGGSFIRCHSTGIVSGSKYQVGGLVGGFGGSMISESYSECDVYGETYVGGFVSGLGPDSILSRCYSAGTVQAADHVGGLVGLNRGTISDCYSISTVTVTSAHHGGGLVGCNLESSASISRCYSAGKVIAIGYSDGIGGLLGNRDSGVSVTSCFWDRNTSGESDGVGDGSSSGVTGLTTEEMMAQHNFVSAGWDFLGESANGTEEIWTMCRWVTYPLFSREVSPPDSVYYVDGPNGNDNNDGLSLETAFATIQKGIDMAWHGNTIIVSPGTYIENINFGAKRLTLRSFDPIHPELTIIDGNDLDSVVTFVGSENANCKMMGFTIMGGNAAGSGGGIHGNFTRATISNCIIRDNISQNRGGGVSRYDGVLEGCIIAGNSTKNRGGGVLDSDCAMTNCLIYDNSVGYLEGSTEGYGGAMYNCGGTITNCTIAFNRSYGRAGGLDGYNGTIANCIVWGNELEQLLNCSQPTYSCIQDWSGGGTGNIDADPRFLDVSNGDLRLLPDSPCIDAGDPNHAAAPGATDLDGNPRILDGDNDGEAVVDMGAYEADYIEVAMNFTPQALNLDSGGKWVKAHFVLAEGFAVEDVDANTPAVIAQLGIESEYMNVFINDEGLVKIEAAFRRGDFCAAIDYGPGEVTVIGRLTSGQYFWGSDTIRIITNKLGYVGSLASYWLEADCGPLDWCGGLDVDQDSVVDWLDFAMSDGCCIEVIEE